ncbi:hypothetical protein ABIB62_000731 [Mucilaginibacter sp. UYP25]
MQSTIRYVFFSRQSNFFVFLYAVMHNAGNQINRQWFI